MFLHGPSGDGTGHSASGDAASTPKQEVRSEYTPKWEAESPQPGRYDNSGVLAGEDTVIDDVCVGSDL